MHETSEKAISFRSHFLKRRAELQVNPQTDGYSQSDYVKLRRIFKTN